MASLVVALSLTLFASQGARAAGFQFSPLRVNLTAHDHAASVTLTNNADTPLRMEIRALGWTQRADGQALLVPTSALLAFPELVTIPPHSQRRIRVATTDPPGPKEVAYMVSVAEIPAFAPKKKRGAGVSLILQANIPVFVAAVKEQRVGAIASANVAKRMLTFAVVNTGSRHFLVKNARVTGQGEGERGIFAANLDGGVVLAGEKRGFRVELPRKDCAELRALTVRLEAGDQHLVQTMDVPTGACNP